MRLQLMTEQQHTGGARCLDGTPGGFYMDEPGRRAQPADLGAFHVHFEGGGWCYSDDECETRAQTMGSGGSRTWRSLWEDPPGGLFSDDCAVNPAFCPRI